MRATRSRDVPQTVRVSAEAAIPIEFIDPNRNETQQQHTHQQMDTPADTHAPAPAPAPAVPPPVPPLYRAPRLASALRHLPLDSSSRLLGAVSLSGLTAADRQRRVKAKVENHMMDIQREKKQQQTFEVEDGQGGVTKMFEAKEFNVRPALAIDPNATVNGRHTNTNTLPMHDQHAPTPQNVASFTSIFSVPSLAAQLPSHSDSPNTRIAPPITPISGSKRGRLASVNNPFSSYSPQPSFPPPHQLAPHLQPLIQQLMSASPSALPKEMTELLSREIAKQSDANAQMAMAMAAVSPSKAATALPRLTSSHLQQLSAMHQHHSSQQSAALAASTIHPMAHTALQPQQLTSLLKIYEEHQNRTSMPMYYSTPMQSSASAMRARYEQQRMDRLALESHRAAETKESRQKRELRKAFLQSVKHHREGFLQFHKERRKVAKAISAACAKIESDLERKRQAEEARQAKARLRDAEQRLAALKANNFDAYSELIKDCKSQRIQLLLQQTAKWEQKLRDLIRTKRQAGQRAEIAQQRAKEEKENEKEGKQTESGEQKTAINEIDDSPLLELHDEKVSQPRLMTGGELKSYQLVGIQWLVSLYNNHLNGILADEMGLGKTIQCIGLIAHLMEVKRNPGPFLVIAPLSTLKNWRSEFTKWTPDIKTVWYNGTPDVRAAMWKTQLQEGSFNVLLTSYEYIMNKHDLSKLSAVKWKHIIIDEGHRVKNHQSKLSVTLAQRYHCPHRLILSGTPLQNSLVELWSLLNFLLPTIFDSVESFQEWFSKPFENQGIKAEDAADSLLDEEEKLLIIHRLHTILRPFLLRRMKSDVLAQLPKKVEIIIKSALTPWQRVMYQQIQSQSGLQTVDASGQVKKKQMSNMFMQLRKIVNHPYLFELTNPDFQTNYVVGPDLVRVSGKFDLLHRILPKLIHTGHKVLLFSQMTRVLDLIEDYCEWKAIKFVRLDGSSLSEVRSKAQDDFNAPNSDIHLFIMSTRAGGLGLNLQVADTVILFDSDWNPQADLQAMDRAHRLGQCWGPGTRLMQVDGTGKKVEDIVVGDQLMGDDGTPRTVHKLFHGHTGDDAAHATPDQPTPAMYRITPSLDGMSSWTCNGAHVLVLGWNRPPSDVHATDDIDLPYRFTVFEQRGDSVILAARTFATHSDAVRAHAHATATFAPLEAELTVAGFLSCDPHVRENAAMFQTSTPMHFHQSGASLKQRMEKYMGTDVSQTLLVETAWVLGLYATSGSEGRITLPNDEEATPLREKLHAWCNKVSNAAHCGVAIDDAVPFASHAYSCDLLLHLAESYQFFNVGVILPRGLLDESVPIRRGFAAGILDTRGQWNDASRCITFAHADKLDLPTLSHLMRGLGCHVTVSKDHNLINVNYCTGLAAIQPVLQHKRAPNRKLIHSFSQFCFGFDVVSIGDGAYHGVGLDGNQRCVLWGTNSSVADFTVTHNSREVRVFRFISLSPVEEKILARAQEKLKMDQMVIQSGKFDTNKKTTSEERQGLLQDILRSDIKLGGAAAPTDSEVNRMICRSEAEFAEFERMDASITAEDAAIWRDRFHKPCPDRFITEAELPLHVRHVDLKALLNQDAEPDKSTRAARTSTGEYTEQLSEREWLRCVDRGSQTEHQQAWKRHYLSAER